MRILLLFLCAVLWSAPVQASTKTIVFLGDSLTAGFGLPEEAAYPALIQEHLREDGLPWKVVNAGVSGDTTSGGLRRLNWVLRSSPTIVFVALGANDGLRGFDVEYSRENLGSIILKLKKTRVTVILSGMQLPVNYGESYRKEFRKMYGTLARKHKIKLFPFLLEGVAMKPGLNQADGVHPNEKGQEKIAHKLYKFLLPILKKAGRS